MQAIKKLNKNDDHFTVVLGFCIETLCDIELGKRHMHIEDDPARTGSFYVHCDHKFLVQYFAGGLPNSQECANSQR